MDAKIAIALALFGGDPAPPKAAVPIKKEFFVPKAKLTAFRRPDGHTHTCTSCGETWDHRANPTHKCANCGGLPPTETRYDRKGNPYLIYLTDPVPRMVPVKTAAPPAPVTIQRQSPISFQDCPT